MVQMEGEFLRAAGLENRLGGKLQRLLLAGIGGNLHVNFIPVFYRQIFRTEVWVDFGWEIFESVGKFFAFVSEGEFGEGKNLESLGVGDEVFVWCDFEHRGFDFWGGKKVSCGDAFDQFGVGKKGDLKG